MDKIEYRAVIKFFVKEGLTPNEIHSKFIKVYGDSSPSFSIINPSNAGLNPNCHFLALLEAHHILHVSGVKVNKWAAEFKRGRTSLEDDPREGRPKSVTRKRRYIDFVLTT
jgi:histone-lysine N-methyltransferase SETMAR